MPHTVAQAGVFAGAPERQGFRHEADGTHLGHDGHSMDSGPYSRDSNMELMGCIHGFRGVIAAEFTISTT